MSQALNLRDRITHSHCQSGAAQQWNVWKIISDVGDGGIGHSRLVENLFIGWHFDRLLHVNEVHAHFFCAPQEGRALPSSDASGTEAGGVREGQPLAVVGIEGLDLEGNLLGWRKQSNSAIC